MNKTEFFPPLPPIISPVKVDEEENIGVDTDTFVYPHTFTTDSLNCSTLFEQHKIDAAPFQPKVVVKANDHPITLWYNGVQCHILSEYKELLQVPDQLWRIQAWVVVWKLGYGDCLHLILVPHIDTLSIEANTAVSTFNIYLNGKVTAHWDPYIPDGLSNIRSFAKFVRRIWNDHNNHHDIFGYYSIQRGEKILRAFLKKAKKFENHLRKI